MDSKIGKVKVTFIGPGLLELTPPWYKGIHYCIKALPEIQKRFTVLSAFAVDTRLYVIFED